MKSILTLLLRITMTAALLMGTVAQSHAILISATERGAYRSDTGAFGTGGAGTASGNYLTGLRSSGVEFRSFFNFDLSSVSGTITSATFDISLDSTFGDSPNPFETLGIFDVTTSIADLINNTGGLSAFADLGSGTQFASASVSTTATSGTVSIAMNAAGLSALNAAIGGDFAVGGALTSLAGVGVEEFLFGSSLNSPATIFDLNITTSVPEPTILALLCFGLVGIGFARKTRVAA